MKWYEKLYVGKTVKKKKEFLMRGLEEGKRLPGSWVIMLPEGEINQLELVPAWNLKFWHRKAEDVRVVGIAGSREEAGELLTEMVQDVLRETGSADLRVWFAMQENFVQTAHSSEDSRQAEDGSGVFRNRGTGL